MSDLTKRERLKLPEMPMPERPAPERRYDFVEVNLGYDADMAVAEAERCLLCAQPTCVDGCPVGIRINDFIQLVADRRFVDAAQVISEDSSLPAICGRVCPQEVQCEGACVLAKKGKAIHIGHLERFVADHVRERDEAPRVTAASPTGRKVAIVGSGPSGLACATDLARAGHEVTVFEALHELGGVLVYGIPEFRLPKSIVASEIEALRSLGVRFETNAVIGMIDTVDDLLTTEGFDAVFIGVGAGLPRFLDIPGENLIGIYSANEFLTRVNLMRAYAPDADTPLLDLYRKHVAVFGGGNTAMDAVRTAVRLGAGTASIIYRRTQAEMPARVEEIHHALDEGVQLVELASPIEFIGDDEGRLVGARLQHMELGPPGEDGRRRPQPIEGAITEIPLDVAIVAIGNAPNPLLLNTTPDLEQTRWGTLAAEPETGQTSKRGVFAGGDIVTGGATVILAMGAGRRAAAAIDAYLRDLEITNSSSDRDRSSPTPA